MTKIPNEFDLDYLQDLLVEYEQSTGKEKINSRNAVVELLLPLVSDITGYYAGEDSEDLFQEAVVSLMESIDNWKSYRSVYKKGNLLYFIQCLKNFSINYCKKQSYNSEKETSIDPLEQDFWGFLQCNQPPSTFSLPSLTPYREENLQMAYDACVEARLGEGLDHRNMTELVKTLRSTFGISHKEAREVVDHAEATLREVFLERLKFKNSVFQENLNKETLFARMVPYIQDGNLKDLIRIFGGMAVRIPKGV